MGQKIGNQLMNVGLGVFDDLEIHYILQLERVGVGVVVWRLFHRLLRRVSLRPHTHHILHNCIRVAATLLHQLCVSQQVHALVSAGDEIANQLILLQTLNVVAYPLLHGTNGELPHKDIPVVKVGVTLPIRVT